MRTVVKLLLWAALAGCRAVPDREANSAGATESTGKAPPVSAGVAPIIVERWGRAAASTPPPPPSPSDPAAPAAKPVAPSRKPASAPEKPASAPEKAAPASENPAPAAAPMP